uniref:Uncharacterized protein n=1 Tax=viral metagenome TaxID=1070528 RepID=A0A6M3IZU0_9ZZZZ
MARATFSTPVEDAYGQSVTLATTLAITGLINVRQGYRGLHMWCDADWKYLLTPKIHYVLFYNATAETFTNYTAQALDNDASTDVVLDGMIATDYLYILTTAPISGLGIDMDASAVNAVTAALDMEYYKTAGWTNVSNDVDGTDSPGATLSKDGTYVWDALTDATPIAKDDAVNGIFGFYGIRFTPNATLSASTRINGLMTIHNGTSYALVPANDDNDGERFNYDDDKVGTIQVLAVSATPVLAINHIKYKG